MLVIDPKKHGPTPKHKVYKNITYAHITGKAASKKKTHSQVYVTKTNHPPTNTAKEQPHQAKAFSVVCT